MIVIGNCHPPDSVVKTVERQKARRENPTSRGLCVAKKRSAEIHSGSSWTETGKELPV